MATKTQSNLTVPAKPVSILRPEFNGSMFIGGKRGMGKTYLAAQAENPALTVFFDFDEQKGEGLHKQLGFGRYYPITSLAANKGAVALWNLFEEKIKELPEGEFTTAIIDNVSPLEQAMNAEVLRDPAGYAKRYGMVQKNIVDGAFGGSKGAVNYMISDRISAALHAKGIRLIIVTAHVKDDFQKRGKKNLKGADRWHEIGILTLILIPNRTAPFPPAALVVKEQLGSMAFDAATGEFTVVRRLPQRLPVATFKNIRDYLDNPVDLASPDPEEVPTTEESNPYDDELSKEQIALMRAEAELSLVERQQQVLVMERENAELSHNPFTRKPNPEDVAKQMLADGKSDVEIIAETGVSKVVLRALKG